MYTTLIRVNELNQITDDVCIVDCRFSLFEPELGAQQFAQSHLPDAVYAHLDDDLSGEIIFGRSGRHPLPEQDDFLKTLRQWGVNNRTQVVAYDNSGGPFAARLWWLLRWIGHESVAVLDGGFDAWEKAGMPTTDAVSASKTGRVTTREPLAEVITAEEILADKSWTLLDAREGARYRGDAEPIDPVAGHIPNALNLPFQRNIDDDKQFLSGDALVAEYREVLRETPAEKVVCYCGSGITAAHNALAMTHAGLGTPKLYAGSWSEWITDPDRPTARESNQ